MKEETILRIEKACDELYRQVGRLVFALVLVFFVSIPVIVVGAILRNQLVEVLVPNHETR